MIGMLSYAYLSKNEKQFFRPIRFSLLLSLAELRFLAQAIGILMFVTRSVFNDQVITIQEHSSNWTLCFRPVTWVVRYLVVPCIFLQRWIPQRLPLCVPVFHFCINQDFIPVGYQSQGCLSVPLLFLVEYARDRYHRCIRIQHVYFFFRGHT